MAIVVLVVTIFKSDNLREKRPVPLAKQSNIACFTNSCSAPVDNCHSRNCNFGPFHPSLLSGTCQLPTRGMCQLPKRGMCPPTKRVPSQFYTQC